MAEESQKEVDNETPNPMKSVLDELAKLRKENKRLNAYGRLDKIVQSVQQPSARKSLFGKKQRQSTVDPNCSVSRVLKIIFLFAWHINIYHKIDVLLVDLCLIDRFASAIML